MLKRLYKKVLTSLFLFYKEKIKGEYWYGDMLNLLKDTLSEHPNGGIGSAIFLRTTTEDNAVIEATRALEEQMGKEDTKIRATIPLGMIPLPETDDYNEHKKNITIALQGSQAMLGWKQAMVVQDVWYLTDKDKEVWELASRGVPIEVLESKKSALIFNIINSSNSRLTRKKTIFGYMRYEAVDGKPVFHDVVWKKGSPPDGIIYVTPKAKVADILPSSGRWLNAGQD